MTLVFCIVVLIVNIILWVLCFKRIRKEFSPDGSLNELKKEVDKIIIEINKETDTDITIIEAKCKQIKDLLALADKKLNLYQETIDQRKLEVETLNKLSEQSNKKTNPAMNKAVTSYQSNFQPKMASSVSENLPLFTENAGIKVIEKNSDEKNNKSKKKQSSLKDNEFLGFSNIEELNNPSSDFESKSINPEEVIQMKNKGFSPEAIALQLNTSINEIEMMIDLYT